MKLRLRSSGGLGAVDVDGQIDTADLPEELARRIEEHLTAENLSTTSVSRSLPMPDARQYELYFLPEDVDGEVATHVVDDMCPVGEVLDVIDDLMAHLIERKATDLAQEETEED